MNNIVIHDNGQSFQSESKIINKFVGKLKNSSL